MVVSANASHFLRVTWNSGCVGESIGFIGNLIPVWEWWSCQLYWKEAPDLICEMIRGRSLHSVLKEQNTWEKALFRTEHWTTLSLVSAYENQYKNNIFPFSSRSTVQYPDNKTRKQTKTHRLCVQSRPSVQTLDGSNALQNCLEATAFRSHSPQGSW